MKTTKIILITALVTLGTALFGQTSQVEFITVSQTVKSSRFENLVNGFLSLTERTARKEYHEPVVYMSYTVNQADVVYEEEYSTESWMSSPFESSVTEADLCLESWMLSPFESSVTENDLDIESWMTTPFEAAETI
ncbi:MAG: hypothetical protein K8R52_11245 [Bacteroidales bacterium]|nr:hypothetical protein [Bacteroidales bacterium]